MPNLLKTGKWSIVLSGLVLLVVFGACTAKVPLFSLVSITKSNGEEVTLFPFSGFSGLSGMDVVTIIVFSVFGILLYFIPSVVAWKRKHRQFVPIMIVNLFLGWSFVGWVIALAWSFMSPSGETSASSANDGTSSGPSV